MDAPRVTGQRLGLVVGTGMSDPTGAGLVAGADPVTMTTFGRDGAHREVELFDRGDCVVLVRHGPGVPAHRLDHHAHVRALCEVGCDRVLALGSTGSLRTDWPPGTMAAPDDFLAFGAYPSFHDDLRGHSVPGFDLEWRARVLDAWGSATSTPLENGGVYAQTRGPRLETAAEVRMLAHHADVVGMTLASEAILAGEAGLRYTALCKVDNLANGLGARPLTMEELAEVGAATRELLIRDLDALLPLLT